MRITQHALDDLNEFSAHHLRLSLAQDRNLTRHSILENDAVGGQLRGFSHHSIDEDQEVALTVKLFAREKASNLKAELRSHSTILDISYAPGHLPSSSSSSSALANFIATKLQRLFAEEQAIIAHILSSGNFPSNGPLSTSTQGQRAQNSQAAAFGSRDARSQSSRTTPTELAEQHTSRVTKSLKYAPTYHLTVSLFTPIAAPSGWDIEDALNEYLVPLLNWVSVISNFTVDTQVQLYATFSPFVQSPEHDPELGCWTLREEDLSRFINAAEWPLSPSIGPGPTLNFIVYVPDPETSPLVVKESHASSWLIPQWGSVFILNPQHERKQNSTTLSREEIQPALLTFSHQLLSFLGVPKSPLSLPLQLQTLTRVRAASLLLSASSTMGSLARLTVALPSIAIPETVSTAVDTTLFQLRSTCDALKNGRFKDALDHARIAESEAEKGFFEKSMVGQVYFPDEHKVAVYLPLLGPVGVPLIMSALKELKRLWILTREHGLR